MLTGLTITPKYGNPLALTVPRGADGYLITNITGLGPVPVSLASSQNVATDGDAFHGSRRDKRTIVITFKIEQNYSGSSIETRRRKLQDLFSTKDMLRLDFIDDGREQVYIEGAVESLDVDIFTSDPVISVSLVCFDPDFKSASEVLRSDEVFNTPFTFEYDGTIPTGVILDISETLDPVTRFSIDFRLVSTDERIGYINSIEHPGSFGPVMRINTQPGYKSMTMPFVGVNIFNLFDFEGMVWPLLVPGEILVDPKTHNPDSQPPNWEFSMKFTERFGAI